MGIKCCNRSSHGMLRFLPSLVASIRVKRVERASGEAAIDPTLEVADSNGLYIDFV